MKRGEDNCTDDKCYSTAEDYYRLFNHSVMNKKGSDYSETFQLREYVPGDSIKQIHWKLSEKLDKLVVREASLPVQKSTLVFWDKYAENGFSPEEADAMAEVATESTRPAPI